MSLINLVYLMIMAGPLLLFACWGLLTYNSLVKRRHQVEDAWSGINVQLQRRNNLIPVLERTVSKFVKHDARHTDPASGSADLPGNASQIKITEASEAGRSGLLLELLSEGEKYPELGADHQFAELQKSFDQLETGIQQARRYYNGVAREYNTKVDSFPANFLAMKFGFLQAEYFDLEDLRNSSKSNYDTD